MGAYGLLWVNWQVSYLSGPSVHIPRGANGLLRGANELYPLKHRSPDKYNDR